LVLEIEGDELNCDKVKASNANGKLMGDPYSIFDGRGKRSRFRTGRSFQKTS